MGSRSNKEQAGAAGGARLALLLAALGLLAMLSAPTGARAGLLPRPQAPAQATPTGPGGTWQAVHGPNLAPLWVNDPPTLRGLHIIETPAGLLGYAVGDLGALLRFDGSTWTKLDDLDPKKTGSLKYDLADVFVIAPDDVWVVGSLLGDRLCGTAKCGALLHYDGRTWTLVDHSSYGLPGKVPPMRAIDMLQDETGNWYGWVVGDDLLTDTLKALILRYKDGKWRVWSGPNNLARHLWDVKLVSPAEAWLVGEAGVESWYTEKENGQGDWAALGKSGADNLYALDLADPLYGWDGGDGGRMNRYQGHCHDEEPESNTQCWFDNQARPVRNKAGINMSLDVYDIDLASRDSGWLVGAASARRALVAFLEPGLENWRQAEIVGDPGYSLYALDMISERAGFAVGERAVIVRYTDDTAPTPTATEAPPSATTPPTATDTPPSATPVAPTATASATDSPSAVPSASSQPPTVTATPSPTDSPTATATATLFDPPTATATDRPASDATIYLPFTLRPRRR